MNRARGQASSLRWSRTFEAGPRKAKRRLRSQSQPSLLALEDRRLLTEREGYAVIDESRSVTYAR